MYDVVYIVTVSGILIGYTDNRYIVKTMTSDEFDPYHRNQVTVYDNIKTDENLINVLRDDFFAEEHYDYELLDYYKLQVFSCKTTEETTITSIYNICENIAETECLSESSHALVKALHDLALLSKYIGDPNFSKVISYIMMTYSRKILTWQTMGEESPHVDKIKLLMGYGYLNKL